MTATSMPSAISFQPNVRRSSPLSRSVPTVDSRMPTRMMAIAFGHRAARQHHGEHQAQHHQGEVVGRAEQQRHARQRGGERGDDERGDAPGDERADGGNAERHAGAPLLGHLMAVERGDHRCRLAGDVDEDGRGRAAVLGAVVDAGQHDERAGRIDAEGDRQQHGDGGDRADARQHADQRADEATDEAQRQVLERQRNRHPQRQVVEEIDHGAAILAAWLATTHHEPLEGHLQRVIGAVQRPKDAHRVERDRQVEQILEQEAAGQQSPRSPRR